ncbi:MAG TPA: citrate synthase [Acidimicrobiales bacterium]|nr:citrate synthase [Acidimicrobiales bacterium]
MSKPWLSSEQAASALDVKLETLYAYVSRGLIISERVPGERRSRYRRADVERLAQSSGKGGRAGALEIIIETDLTLLDPAGRLFYRGWDVEDAAESATFELVATWLWTAQRVHPPFDAPPVLAAAARAITDTFDGAPLERARLALVGMRSADPLRDDRRPSAVAAAGRAIIATLLEVLPLVGDAPPPQASVAHRLWPRLTGARASKGAVRELESALVVLADHELAASTLAARVAASTWADPYLVVTAGLAALGGPLHGGSAELARELVREVRDRGESGASAVGSRLRDAQLIPGFGHSVYLERDPRADVLLRNSMRHRSATRAAARSILDTMRERELPFANVDFGLAVLAEANAMIPGATEIIFAIARTAGWLAHSIEEYEHRLRFRPRASYTGIAPPIEEVKDEDARVNQPGPTGRRLRRAARP